MVCKEIQAAKAYPQSMSQFRKQGCLPVARGIFFFHNVDVSMDGTTRLPDIYRLNLLAASKQFESVELFMYQTLLDELPGISVLNASRLTPQHVASALLEAGWRVQHLADRVRMQGVGQKGGWFCDLDQLWFCLERAKPAPASGFHSAASNYVTKYRGGKKKRYTNYLRKQGEQLYISVPFHFPCNSPICVTRR